MGKEEGKCAVSCLLWVVFKVELGRSAPGSAHTGNKDSKFCFYSQTAFMGKIPFEPNHISSVLWACTRRKQVPQSYRLKVSFFPELLNSPLRDATFTVYFEAWVLQTTSDPEPGLRTRMGAAVVLWGSLTWDLPQTFTRGLRGSKIRIFPYSKSHRFANKLLSTYIILC